MGKETWLRDLNVTLGNNLASASLARLSAESSHYKEQYGNEVSQARVSGQTTFCCCVLFICEHRKPFMCY